MWVKRGGYIFIVITNILILLVFRIFYVNFGSINSKTKEVAGGRSATLDIYNSKGIIYDRNLFPIAGGQFAYYLVINPRGFDKSKFEYISELTNTSADELIEKLNKEAIFVLKSYYKPENVDGVYVYEGTTRYPETLIASHLIGYLDSEDNVGLSGVEKSYSDYLSEYSVKTSIKYSTNAVMGAIVGLGIDTDKTSNDTKNGLILTLDKNLSIFAEQSLNKYIQSGCVIVMNCNNGELYAMASTPAYDPGNIANYINSENGELVNNAMTNQTVGSVFKMVVAASALLNDFGEFTYMCSGSISVGGRVFSCQNGTKHGEISLNEAFSKSCNCYFIAIGQLLGYDNIIETAQLFGVDSSIEIAKNMSSSAGILPDNEGVQSIANLSIGQGKLLVSPIEIARITAVMCNGGYLVNPTVYYGMYVDEQITAKSEYTYKSGIIESNIAERLKEMCELCVTSGTGVNAKTSRGSAGGKTASAQTGRYDETGKEILNTYFTGFYPANNPQYVITVFASNGESGSKTCAPVFCEICDFIAQNY